MLNPDHGQIYSEALSPPPGFRFTSGFGPRGRALLQRWRREDPRNRELRLAQSAGDVLPYQFWLMVPFVLSILALVAVSRRAEYPQALMKPYRKGER